MRRTLNIVIWVVIAILAIGTGVWSLWASHQPGTHSIWAPDTDSSIPP